MGELSEGDEPWLFLRGLARENAHWDDFPALFESTVPKARVHLLDLPGNGALWRLDSPLDLAACMEFVRREARDRIAALGDGARVRLFAMSLGAMVSIAWAARHPEEVAAAVLVNTSVGGFCPFHRRLHWRCWRLMLRIATAGGDVARRERLILELTARHKRPTEAFIQSRVDTYRLHPVRARNVLRQLWAAACFRPPRQGPAVPLLLLNSLGDRMVDPRCSDALARAWSTELRTHPDAGHDLPLDDPLWTLAQVSSWQRQAAG